MSIMFTTALAANLDISNRPFMKNTGGGTLMAWVTIRVLPASFATVIGFFGATGTTRAKFTVDSSGNILVRATALDADATSAFTTAATALNVNQRYHLAVVYNFSSKSGIVYVDGSQYATGFFVNMTAGNTSNTNCSNGSIGSQELGGSNFWDGEIEDCRVYDRALGPAEITTIFAGRGRDSILQNCQARWGMHDDQAPGTVATGTVADLTGSKFGAIPVGTMTYAPGSIVTRQKPVSNVGASW